MTYYQAPINPEDELPAEDELVTPERSQEDKDEDPNYIPETNLSEQDNEDIFGVGEREDGSIDEMERSDVDDALAVDDDFSDVLDFDASDVTGEPPKKKPTMRFKRTARPYRPIPPSSMGGLRL